MDALEHLRNGSLIAVGYAAGSNVKAQPLIIPNRFLEMKFIRWHDDKILDPPHEFRNVRIIDAGAQPNVATRPTVSPSKKLGRPGVENDVINAMRSLAKDNPNATFAPHKKWVPLIRDRVHKIAPNKYGPNQPADRTIMRIIPVGRNRIVAMTTSQS